MIEKQDCEERPILLQLEPVPFQQKSVPEVVESNLTQRYHEIMGQDLSKGHLQQLVKSLKSSKEVGFDDYYFHETIKAKIIDQTPNQQMVTLEILYGHFRCQLTVYCQQQESYSHCLPNKGNHQSSNVFIAKKQTQIVVIKCYTVPDPEQFIHVFGGALKQYCLQKFAHALGVGPQLIRLGDFDIIVSQKCVEFGMEKCQQITAVTEKLNKESIEKELKMKLIILHTFHLVHLDIKPQNIMYSELSSQIVFIDYGFSKLIKQEKGFKTKTQFAGSINYCGQQMRAAASSKSVAHFVDLYYNDSHALKITIQEIHKLLQQGDTKFVVMNHNMELYDDYFNQLSSNNLKLKQFWHQQKLCQLKKMIWHRDQNIFEEIKNNQVLINLKNKKIIEFILEFPFKMYYEKIIREISENISDKRHLTEYVRRLQFKKEKMIKNLMLYEDQQIEQHLDNYFLTTIGIYTDENQINFTFVQFQLIIIIKYQLNIKLLNSSFIETLHPHIYLQEVARMIDLRTSLSSFSEKIVISKIFQEKYFQKEENHEQYSQIRRLEQSFRWLLKIFMKSKIGSYEEIVPLLIENLIILEALSFSELQQIMKNIINEIDNPVKTAMLVFRLSSLKFWLFQKVATRFSYEQMCFVEYKLLDKLNQLAKENRKLKIIEILYEIRIGQMKKQVWNNNIQTIVKNIQYYIKQSKFIDQGAAQQITFFVIVGKIQFTFSRQNQIFLKMMIYLSERGKQLHKMTKLDYTHLKYPIFQQSKYVISSQLTLGLQKIINNLAQGNLARQFLFYHNIMLNSHLTLMQTSSFQQLYNDLTYLIQASDLTKISMNPSFKFIYKISKRIKQIKNDETVKKLEDKFKTLINCQLLNKTDFRCMALFSTQNLLMNFYYIVKIVYRLYKAGDPELEMIKIFCKRIKDNQKGVQGCPQCQKRFSYIMKVVQIMIMKKENMFNNGIQICIQQIMTIQALQNQSFIDNDHLKRCLFQMMALCQRLINSQDKLKYQNKAYEIIRQNRLFELVFNYQKDQRINMFISRHILRIRQSLEQYLQYHFQLLAIVKEHPFFYNVKIYLQLLLQVMNRETELLIPLFPDIMQLFFKEVKEKKISNPYTCLFATCFLLLLTPQQKLKRKMVVQICKSVDLMSISARVRVLQFLTQLIYDSKITSTTKRSQARKIRVLVNYLMKSGTFNKFQRRLRWKKHKRPKQVQSYKLLKKKKRFFENLTL